MSLFLGRRRFLPYGYYNLLLGIIRLFLFGNWVAAVLGVVLNNASVLVVLSNICLFHLDPIKLTHLERLGGCR